MCCSIHYLDCSYTPWYIPSTDTYLIINLIHLILLIQHICIIRTCFMLQVESASCLGGVDRGRRGESEKRRQREVDALVSETLLSAVETEYLQSFTSEL